MHTHTRTHSFLEAEQGLVGQSGKLHCSQAGKGWLQDGREASQEPEQKPHWVALSQALQLLS